MSAPDPRYPDKNSVPSIFGRKRKPQPEEIRAEMAIESLRDIPENIPAWEDIGVPTPPRQIDLLVELAVILRRLTWSQMTEFGNGISADPKNIHEWSSK
jgi:hypothetical protein